MRMNEYQREVVLELLSEIKSRSPFYAEKFRDIDLTRIRTQEDFETLPFTDKGDLREAYPLGLAAVPERDIVRIHSSSGTTGTPVVIPYTKKDAEDWAVMFERCYRMAGITEKDRIQITPGYGLWTAGIGFQAGCERLGAMAIPMGPGNTEKQLRMMEDMQSTVLCATSSYALLLAEEIKRRGIKDRLALRKGVIGSERWGEKMRNEIAADLGVEFYDIYGLTEIYGPGIGISCDYRNGIHMWDDYLYFEIIDPKTGETVPDGTVGELVITTLRKEGAPLIRYRTHDLTRIIPGECPCGRHHRRAHRRHDQGQGGQHVPRPVRRGAVRHRRGHQRVPGHDRPSDGQGPGHGVLRDRLSRGGQAGHGEGAGGEDQVQDEHHRQAHGGERRIPPQEREEDQPDLRHQVLIA